MGKENIEINQDVMFIAIKTIFNTIIKALPAMLLFWALLVSGWKTFGEDDLLVKTRAQTDSILAPVISVVDTMYYVSMETNEMVKQFLKEQNKPHIIQDSKEKVERQKSIDDTRNKLGKDKFINRRK